MTRPFFPALLVVVLLCCGAVAHADIITYSGYINFDATGSGTVNVNQFDAGVFAPNTATLTGVTVYIYQTSTAGFAVDNDDVNPATAQAQMLRIWTLNGAGGTLMDNATEIWNSPSVALSAENGSDDGTVDFTSPDGYNWGTVSFSELHNTHVVNSSNWGAYTGSGTVAFNITMVGLTNSIAWVGTPSNSYQSQITGGNPNQRFQVRIDYEYDSNYVPEPGTWALLTLGIAGIGAWRRRRAAAAA